MRAFDEADQRAVTALRVLAIDQVEAARSGHPGLPLGAAPMAYALWSRFLRFDPPTLPGPTATASCSRPGTARRCCTPSCTCSATTSRSRS